MAYKFTKLANNRTAQLTSSACQEIQGQFKIDDKRGNISLGNAIWFQFWAHQALDSFEVDGEMFNRYDGMDNGQGVYPARMDSPLLNRDGTFKVSDIGLPYLQLGEKDALPVEMTVDAHRGNEHRTLKAFHLMAIKLHNVRMAEHGDFEQAKAETVALLNRITMNETEIVTGLTESEILNGIKIADFHLMMEFNFGAARWAHAQMPDTVNGDPIFQKGFSSEIDLIALFKDEKARALNLGVSTAMTQMTHVRTPHDILERTFSRHAELNLAPYQALELAVNGNSRVKTDVVVPEGCPIWPGILLEAEQTEGDTLGPVGARAVADGVGGSLLWGKGKGLGLWHPLWRNAPATTVDIIEYANS